MIMEILQFIDIILSYRIHLLILFFLSFVLTPALATKIKSRRYKPYEYDSPRQPVTIIVPVYDEPMDSFRKCLLSIRANMIEGDQLIVATENGNDELLNMAARSGAEVVHFEGRGKRLALASAWERADNPIVVQMDSDVVMQEGCIDELVKPFADPSVVGVATNHDSSRTKSGLAYAMSKVIELSLIHI